ncbi:hypothetical protein AB0K80_29545 [Streptomyces sp. NPDC052682]|uniref:hypothetical protein n=1 Tax=Streptomyces sp. NPDC052682 TaxID=3154954 RepID=UPI0034291031
MGTSAPQEGEAGENAREPHMLRRFSEDLAEATRRQAQAHAEAMSISVQAENAARRARAETEEDVVRRMRRAYAPGAVSSLSVRGRRFGLAFKGTTVGFVAAALVAVGGTVAYVLAQEGGPSGRGAGTPPPAAGPTASPTASSPTASSPTASSLGTSASPAAGSSAGVQGTGGAAAVREERKLVLRTASNLDLDFTDGMDDIALYQPSNDDGRSVIGTSGDLAAVSGPADARTCTAATDFGFTVTKKNIRKGLTACVLTDENRAAAITVLGWQEDDYGLVSVTLHAITWEKPDERT